MVEADIAGLAQRRQAKPQRVTGQAGRRGQEYVPSRLRQPLPVVRDVVAEELCRFRSRRRRRADTPTGRVRATRARACLLPPHR